ncbi:MAG: NADH-ubiquinone oxidoreductase-F iron-sulfur binding region domain-containing protein [Gaiellaceae bacterium]
MSATRVRPEPALVAAPLGLPRLLAGLPPGDRPVTLDEHLARYGSVRDHGKSRGLIDLVEASGLQGRGGAAFPTATKLRAVASRRGRPVVVVNGTEGEPASGKDKVLLRCVPHLVLDGAVAAAEAVGAREAFVAVADGATAESATVAAAIDSRRRRKLDGRVTLRLVEVPDRFVAGEETALVQFLNGGPAKPTFTPPRPFERGVNGAPTLVQNAETLAHIAQIARFGPSWFRRIGTAAEPGSILVTLSGAVARPGVYEVALGSPLRDLLAEAGGVREDVQAYLVGGYFGTWVRADRAAGLRLSEAEVSLGARAIVALPARTCGLAEAARIARYLSDEGAGQCGPCVHGLGAIAGALELLASGDRTDRRDRIARWVSAVRGRGACHHPDGASRFAASALEVFADEVELHLRQGRCSGSRR